MATRRERVILDLQDDLTPGLIRAAAAAKLLDKELNSLGRQSVQTARVSKDIDAIAPAAGRADRSINQLTGRLRVMAEVAAVIAPSLAPIGAVAIPAVTGLASQLGFAAIAGGVLMGSMRGLGTAITAMNKADLEPTAENLAKAEDALNALAPAARDFAKELRGLAPTLKAVRDTGAEALVPGLTESLDDLERLGPKVAAIFESVGGALGDIASDSAASLASERWAGFFEFIAQEAPEALADMASTIGSITHAMAEMWQAFDPLNDDFSSWLRDSAADLDEWATGLSKTQGFAEFVDYIRTNGPQVADTMGAIGSAALDIVEAMAPLGGPVLKGLEAAANVVSAIADSDLGTPIMAGVAALSLLNRSLAVTASLSKVSLSSGIFGGLGTVSAGASKGAGSIRGLSADVGVLARNYGTAGKASERMAAQNKAAAANLKGAGAAAGKAAGLMGGLALVTSGAADGIGLTNTASLALMGTLGGPPGIAIGAAAGALLDLKAAGNQAHDAMVALNAAVDSGNMDEIAAQVEVATKALQDYRDVDWTSPGDILESIGTGIADTFRGDFTNTISEQEKALLAAQKATDKLAASEKANEEAAKQAALAYARSVGVNLDVEQSALATVKQIEAQAKAMEESRAAAQSLADSFGGLGSSLNDNKKSFSQWVGEMEASKQALDNFNDNSIKAASRGLDDGLIVSLRNAGKEGALRMAQIANGSEEGIGRANRAFRELQRETERTRRVTERLSGVVIDFQTEKAMSDIEALEAKLRSIRDEDVFINVREIKTTSLGPRNEAADGGSVPKGGAYFDKHLYMLAPGEEIISNRHGQADAFRADRAAGRIPGYADGGTTGKKRKPSGGLDPARPLESPAQAKARELAEARAAQAAVDAGEAATRAANAAAFVAEQAADFLSGQEKATQEWIDAAKVQMTAAETLRDGIAAQMAAVGQGSTSGFQSDLFGNSNSIWGAAGAGPLGSLGSDIAGLTLRGELQAQLAAAGLDGDALAAALTQGSNQDLSALLASGTVQQFEDMFNERARLTGTVGAAAGEAAYGREFAAASAQVTMFTAQLDQLNAALAAINAQQNPTSAAAAEGYRLQGQMLSNAIVNGGNTVARRGTGGY